MISIIKEHVTLMCGSCVENVLLERTVMLGYQATSLISYTPNVTIRDLFTTWWAVRKYPVNKRVVPQIVDIQ